MGDTDGLDDLDGGEPSGMTGAPKKASGLGAILPNLLKFVAIGLGALIFIITVCVITVNVLNKGGKSQTVVREDSQFIRTRPTYSYFTAIGMVRTRTRDVAPTAVVVEMNLGYDQNDNAASTELTGRISELQDFTRNFFSTKKAEELAPEREVELKKEIMAQLNSRILNIAKIRAITFKQLDVMEM